MRPDLIAALEQLADDATVAETDGDRERMLRTWHELGEVVRELHVMRSVLETAAVDLFAFKEELVLDGIGTVTVTRKGNRTTWDSAATARAVVDRALETGECGHPRDVAAEILRCGRVDWRVTELRARGLDPDELELRDVVKGDLALRIL